MTDQIELKVRVLFLDESGRQIIKQQTKLQSESPELFEVRRIRITASKPAIPKKVMREILHLEENFQSQKLKQGLKDESVILRMYEDKFSCKVNKVGFIISSTHAFLGASPDGGVLQKCLVEVKRIFSVTKTLEEALCSRGIYKKTAVVLSSM